MEKFSEGMLVMGEAFGVEVTNLKLKAYSMALSRFDDDDVQRSMELAVATLRFFPKPVELIELIEGKREDQAELAWGKLIDAAQRVGQYQSVLFEDPRITMAVKLLGGWQRICQSEETSVKFLRKDFLSIFKSLPPGGEPEPLDGIAAINAAAHGYKDRIPAPVKITCDYLPAPKRLAIIGKNEVAK